MSGAMRTVNRTTSEETVGSWHPARVALVYAGGTPWK
jgi:hypothetical protein